MEDQMRFGMYEVVDFVVRLPDGTTAEYSDSGDYVTCSLVIPDHGTINLGLLVYCCGPDFDTKVTHFRVVNLPERIKVAIDQMQRYGLPGKMLPYLGSCHFTSEE